MGRTICAKTRLTRSEPRATGHKPGHKCVKSDTPNKASKTKTEAEIYVSEKILGRSRGKRHWGRDMIIDNWEKLEEVIELIKCSLPINMQVELNAMCNPAPNTQPLPFDPRAGSPSSLNTALPALAEVRLSLFIDETLGWLLPLQFCIGQLLTAKEIVRKITDGFWFLESWSHAHSRDARAHLRFEDLRSECTTKTGRKPLIQ